MARFCSLFSSSSGNSVYIGHPNGGILIDIGVSAKRTAEALNCVGASIESIGAVFVTHEHCDHIAGVRVFAGKHQTTVYASQGTLEGMESTGALNGKYPSEVMPESGVEVNGMFVRAFHTPHDSRESLGYTVEMPDGNRIGIATDIGVVTDEIMQNLLGCQLVLLESNHDVRMLQCNPNYPYILKRRILSDHGHLCNEACAEAAVKLVQSGTTRLLLGHLSKENNMPQLAYQCTNAALSRCGMEEGSDYLLRVAGVGDPKMIVF
ncbi:MAG TPA: MBL fold metallo-hydrolase [Ruminococcaceae bacterium]|nr:MBL fold metallo-hydrolase [Oscillospiraceae bacterium]